MIDIKTLENLALKLNLTMSESEYETLLDEFKIMLKQMDLIDKIDGISEVEPMSHPFPVTYTLRSDDEVSNLSASEVISNAKESKDGKVVVPKVVGDKDE